MLKTKSFIVLISAALLVGFCSCKATVTPDGKKYKAGDIALAKIKIGTTKYDNTAEVYVTGKNGARVTGADPSFVDSEANIGYKGVFRDGMNVTLSPYIMSKYQVTQELYETVMTDQMIEGNALTAAPFTCKETGDYPKVAEETQKYRPAESVTWYDAVFFCNALTEKTMTTADKVYTITDITVSSGHITNATVTADITKKGYRLPTEAEWEFAARDGRGSSPTPYAGNANINQVAWYGENSGIRTHDVATKDPNNLNLYDMCGNVAEWCWDYYSPVLASGAQTNPHGPSSGEMHVKRGGSWLDDPQQCTVFYRSGSAPSGKSSNLGFRVVCSAVSETM